MSTMQAAIAFAESHVDEIISELEADNLSGWCVSCGAYHASGVDPDSTGQRCESCGELAVYGSQELCIMGVA